LRNIAKKKATIFYLSWEDKSSYNISFSVGANPSADHFGGAGPAVANEGPQRSLSPGVPPAPAGTPEPASLPYSDDQPGKGSGKASYTHTFIYLYVYFYTQIRIFLNIIIFCDNVHMMEGSIEKWASWINVVFQ
jgi:hypothetical protein